MKRHRLIALLLLFALLLSACSARYASDTAVNESGGSSAQTSDSGKAWGNDSTETPSAPGESEEEMDTDTPASLDGQMAPGDRKLIKNGSYELETLEFDKTIAAVEALVTASDGYVQSGSITGTGALEDGYQRPRYANYVVRVPAGNFESFAERLADCGVVTDSRQSVDEVTDYYYDLEARVHNLQIQEQRLLTLVGQADDLETIVTLENTLADVRYEIESKQGQLRRLDSQISLSTVNIAVQEVFESVRLQSVPRTLGERISQRFSNTWDDVRSAAGNFVVWLLGDSLMILFWLAVLAAAMLMVRAWKQHRDGLSGEKKSRRVFWRRRDRGAPPPDGRNS